MIYHNNNEFGKHLKKEKGCIGLQCFKKLLKRFVRFEIGFDILLTKILKI